MDDLIEAIGDVWQIAEDHPWVVNFDANGE
jgi:hypothetical protein